MDLAMSSVTELTALIRARRASAVEAVEVHLRHIEKVNPLVNAIVRLDAERARTRAREADAALARGENWGPLHGVPFTLKDMHPAAGLGASVGTQSSERMCEEDGIIAARLKGAGGILLGKTNMSNSVQTVSEQFGRTSNPYDTSRTTGGSSGGAVAAVAARLSPFDVGTDLSGSIRMPAHFAGVFGLRPTVNRIPVAGMISGPPSMPRMDRIFAAAGPMARTATDIALLFRVLAGPDPRDPDVAPVPVVEAPPPDLRGLRIAVAPSIDGIRIAADIRLALERLGTRLADAGARIDTKEPLPFEKVLAAFRRYFSIPLSLAIRAGIAPPGSRAAGAREPTPYDVMVALEERDQFILALERFFADYDAFICPAAIAVAFPHCERGSPIDVDGEPVPSMCIDHPTLLSTYTGSPSLVVPIAQNSAGLPIGAQLVGRRWRDEQLIAIGGVIADVVGPIPPPAMATLV